MKKVLFIGSHPDDIEIGCGATINKHKRDWNIYCATFSSEGLNGVNKGLKTVQKRSLGLLGVSESNCKWYKFRPSFFYKDRQEIWSKLSLLNSTINPDIIFTHSKDDHQDHNTLHEETVRNFYNSSIITYQISRSQRTFDPNYYEILGQEDVDAKMQAMKEYSMYQYEGKEEPSVKFCFYEKTIEAQLRANGAYLGKEYVEAYRSIKIIENKTT